jgi:conjugal transfer pilus assembly protein TraB
MNAKQIWARVPPGIKKWGSFGAGVSTLLVVSYLGVSTLDSGDRKPTGDKVIRSVLTENSTRDVAMDNVAAQIAMQNKVIEDQAKRIGTLARDLEAAKKAEPPSDETVRQLQGVIRTMQTRLDEIDRKGRAERASGGTPGAKPGDGSVKEGSAADPAADPQGIPVAAVDDNPPADPNRPPTVEDIFRSTGRRGGTTPQPTAPATPSPGGASAMPGMNPPTGVNTAAPMNGTAKAAASVKMAHLRGKPASAEKREEEPNLLQASDSVQVPAGSIISGTLLTGMDAPTGQSARKDPFPALLRIKKEAILPNRFILDVRECFILLGGYGDLSSERAYLRTETISCVRNDGRVVETRLEAFATGEDGKTGIRGRLVSKQGQMIANALLAGFMEGVSKAFDVKPVPVIATGGTGGISRQQQYQSNFSTDSFQSAAVSGAGSALDRIAQFYISMAEQTTPVVEIDTGRTVDLIVQRGAKLDFKARGNSSLGLDQSRQPPAPAGGGAGSLLPGPLSPRKQ